jgi:outer membrane protein TolC
MRRRLRTLAAGALVLAAAAAAGDEPPAAPHPRTWWGIPGLAQQWQRDIPASPALHVQDPGARDDQVERVTLKEAIGLALQNNPGIAVRRLEPARVDEGVLEAQGQFDPALASDVISNQSTTPNASALAGRSAINIDDRNANFHLLKTFRTGTLGTIDFLNERLDNDAIFNQLRPQYAPQLNFSLIQPLLRNFGWDFSYLVVRVAEQTADAAVYQYEADLANFVEQVIEAYWGVVRARENLEVQRESKALADRTVVENEARVRVGLLAPVSVLEARADAMSRQEQVIIAENDLDVSRQRLAQIAYYRPAGTFIPRTLEPIEEAVPEEVPANLEETLATALNERPEVHASARTVKAQQLNERIAGNALLPRLDLVGSYGVNGLSGTNRALPPTTVTVRSAVPIPNASCVQDTRGEYVCFVQTPRPGSAFTGDRADAYDELTSNDFRSYSFGLQFQVPLSNAVARSRHTQSRIALSQAELSHRDLLSAVTLEARESVADVVAARQRIDTTRIAVDLAAENLRNQEKRHEVGMATTKDLLDFQTRLTSARAAQVQAKIDHAIAVARWRRARGTLLAQYQIVVADPGRRTPPWFARF